MKKERKEEEKIEKIEINKKVDESGNAFEEEERENMEKRVSAIEIGEKIRAKALEIEIEKKISIRNLRKEVIEAEGEEKLAKLEELEAVREGKEIPVRTKLNWGSLDEQIYREKPEEFLKLTRTEQHYALENIKDEEFSEI